MPENICTIFAHSFRIKLHYGLSVLLHAYFIYAKMTQTFKNEFRN